jgi:hypothetical protein
MNAIGKRRNDLEIMNWIPQIALQIQNSDQSPLYDVRNPASEVCEDLHLRSDVMRTTIGKRCIDLRIPSGGARRDRTDDLMLAKHALSQLSYGPVPEDECFKLDERHMRSIKVVGLGRLELPTSRLSSARSNQLSYKPLHKERARAQRLHADAQHSAKPRRVFVRKEREA